MFSNAGFTHTHTGILSKLVLSNTEVVTLACKISVNSEYSKQVFGRVGSQLYRDSKIIKLQQQLTVLLRHQNVALIRIGI